MAKMGLGRGLGAIFGSDAAQSAPQHRKTVADSLAAKTDDAKTAAQDNAGSAETDKAETKKRAAGKRTKQSVALEVDAAAPMQALSQAAALEGAAVSADMRVPDEKTAAKKRKTMAQSLAQREGADAAESRQIGLGAEKDQGMKLVRISLIQPNLAQPRKRFEAESLQELANSIKTYGVLQPLLVKQQGMLYEIIAGERRWRAAKMAGLREVPVLIKELSDQASREIAIIENIQRADLNAVEEAMAYQSLISEYGMTQEEVAERVSKKRSTITNSLRILRLEPEILELLRDGKITQGHARALLAIEDSALRLKIAERCERENLSVREIEALVRLEKQTKKKQSGKKQTEAEALKRQRVLYKDLERRMRAKLGTKVSIVPTDKDRGRLEIEYYSQEELDRLFTMLNSITEDL